MRKILTAVVLGLATLAVVVPNQAHASWLSEAFHHRSASIYIRPPAPAYVPYVAPSYYLAPAYGYAAPSVVPSYVVPTYGAGYYQTRPVYPIHRSYAPYHPNHHHNHRR